MLLTDYLLKESEKIWKEYYKHPFVQGIEKGTLKKEKFRYYIIQDYLYLEEYIKVFALGVGKSKSKITNNIFINYLNAINREELEIHRTYMNKLNITKKDFTSPRELDNLSYTSYMLRIAYEEDELSILVAILACALSYEKIGKNILKNNPSILQHSTFCEWVEGYSSDEYSQNNKELIDIINKLAENSSKEKKDHLKEIFINCSKYELYFWNFSWNYQEKENKIF